MIFRRKASLAIAFLAVCIPVLAATTPTIESAAPNSSTHQLTIAGTNFGTAPSVKLGGKALTLVSSSTTQIVADLPSGIASGSYLLAVTAGGSTATFSLALGTTGPRGPAGPAGPEGPAGAQGPPGISQGYSAYSFETALVADTSTLLAQSPTIQTAGSYYVTSSVFVDLGTTQGIVNCGVVNESNHAATIPLTLQGVAEQSSSMSGVIYLNSGDILELVCQSNNSTSTVLESGFNAILVQNANGASLVVRAHEKRKELSRP